MDRDELIHWGHDAAKELFKSRLAKYQRVKTAEEKIEEVLRKVSAREAGYGPDVLRGVAAEIAQLQKEGK